MGGKLWNLPRMPRDAYVEREGEVRRCLDRLAIGAYRIPRWYGDKPDFGDMDVLVAAGPSWGDVRASIAGALGVAESRAVGNVFSTVYRGLQTDFFAVPEPYLESAYAFMCFNDLGNFIGRICRRFDLKFGDRGLAYVYRRSREVSYKRELELTRDFAHVCAFLGLDHAAWARGFATLDDVFGWVVRSPWFSVAPYLDEGGPGARRARDRTTVARFIAYLTERGVDSRPAFDDRKSYFNMVAGAFPDADLAARVAREREVEARQLQVSARFSGRRVMSAVPGIEGKALGELIVRFKSSFGGREAFEVWILSAGDDEIDRRIAAFASA